MNPRRVSLDSFLGTIGVNGGSLAIYTEWRNTNATGISESSGLPLAEAGANFQLRSDCFAGAVNGGRSCSTLMFLIAPWSSRDTSKTTMPSAVVWKGKFMSAAETTFAGL